MCKCKAKWNRLPCLVRYIGYFLIGLVGIGLFGLLFGLIIKLLWNWLMPEIFGLNEITYWQGIGLFLIGRLLFGRLGNNNSTNIHCIKGKCVKEVEETNVEKEIMND